MPRTKPPQQVFTDGLGGDKGQVFNPSLRPKRNPAAVSLGRNGGKATAKKLTPDQRSASARRAARARWAKAKGEGK